MKDEGEWIIDNGKWILKEDGAVKNVSGYSVIVLLRYFLCTIPRTVFAARSVLAGCVIGAVAVGASLFPHGALHR
jgi:hypothetical protein